MPPYCCGLAHVWRKKKNDDGDQTTPGVLRGPDVGCAAIAWNAALAAGWFCRFRRREGRGGAAARCRGVEVMNNIPARVEELRAADRSRERPRYVDAKRLEALMSVA